MRVVPGKEGRRIVKALLRHAQRDRIELVEKRDHLEVRVDGERVTTIQYATKENAHYMKAVRGCLKRAGIDIGA